MTILELLQGKTAPERVRILYRILERLRLRHNEKGADFRNGVITQEEWDAFLVVWTARQKRVYEILNVIKENLNLFRTENEATSLTLKAEGKVLETYDADIDINTI